MNKKIEISVIIPTKGNRQTLIQVIENLEYEFNQASLCGEIIIGLDAKERQLISNVIKKLPNGVRLVQKKWYSSSKARNAAAQEAVGSLLAFIDDDIIVNTGWGKTIKNILSQDGYFIWAGGIDCDEAQIPSRKQQEEGVKWFGKHPKFLSSHEYGAAGHFIITYKAWKKIGGFNEIFGNSLKYQRNEDVELFCHAHHIGINVLWEPNLCAKHLRSKPLSENQNVEQGRADFAVDLIYYRFRMIFKILGYCVYTLSSNLATKRRAQGYVLECVSQIILYLLSLFNSKKSIGGSS